METIVIKVDNEVSSYINEQRYYHGFVSEKQFAKHREMTFLTMSAEGFARWFMMFGDHAEVLSPDKVKDRVAEIAEAVVRRNSPVEA